LGVATVAAVMALLVAISQHLRERKASRENVRLTNLLIGKITGGDSFAMAYFPFKDGKYWLAVRHFGNETLHDIRVEAVGGDPPKVLDTFIYPSLPPNSIELVHPIEFRGDSFGFQVSFNAPNGFWAEAVKVVRVEDQLVFALQAWRLIPNTNIRMILREEVHPKFPVPVDWSLGRPVDLSQLIPSKETPEQMISRSLGMM
jgi:hypothetical protein